MSDTQLSHPSLTPFMKKASFFLILPLIFLSACGTFTPQIGMKEQKWLNHTVASDVIYIEGNVKAYRSAGSYYYFKDGILTKVTPTLLSAEKI